MPRSLALALIFAAVLTANPTRADVAACAAAAVHGQDLARSGKLLAARDALRICASQECPELIANDCASWLTNADARLASTVVSVADEHGTRLTSATVEMDGAPIQWADQKPIAVDPGAHTFSVRCDGYTPVDRPMEFGDGSSLTVSISMTPVLAEVPPPPVESAHRRSRGLLAGSLVTSGVAIAGFALFAGFGEAGLSEQSDLRGSCAPHCTSNQVDPLSTKFTIANVGAIAGIVAALGAGALWVLYARSDHVEAPPAQSAR